MESKKSKPLQDFRMSLHGLPYDRTVAAEPPIKVTTAKQLNSSSNPTSQGLVSGTPRTNGGLARRDSGSTAGTRSRKQSFHNDHRIQSTGTELSGRQPDKTSTRNSDTSLTTNGRAPSSLTTAPSVPQIRIDDDSIPAISQKQGDRDAQWPLTGDILPVHHEPMKQQPKTVAKPNFPGLTLDLGGGLGDELQVSSMKFSQRGSMFIDGRKVSQLAGASNGYNRLRPGPQRIATSSSVPEHASPRVMSTDEETLSDKVRSFYAAGADLDDASIANRMGNRWQHTIEGDQSSLQDSRHTSLGDQQMPPSPGAYSNLDSPIVREDNELAGGVEDWQDIDNADVDRYGFIVPREPPPLPADVPGVERSGTVSRPGMQRVSTSLQIASESPRRKHALRRAPSNAHGEKDRARNRRASNPSIKSNSTRPGTSRSTASNTRNSAFRGKDRRLMDDAADMFTLPRSLTSESNELTRTTTNGSSRSATSQPAASKMASTTARKKEVEREEKWRKMAKPIPSSSTSDSKTKVRGPQSVGTTLIFTFPPPSDPKLVSRTWKGIPDSWRAQAWHYFLSVSAAKNPDSLTDDKLINLYHEYQTLGSPHDYQIDIDVPRTINAHIMFRRRYRGGQRLLFRVLHAMSLHRPATGYVQGMAALAATLLAYYEEEKAFLMLVRLWEVRGLGRLYENDFAGLMEVLEHFEKRWLGDGEVAQKLHEVNMFPTAYGTKWYLTLFNYSVPFPAQLRVWDVFMLLGDEDSLSHAPPTNKPDTNAIHDTTTPPLQPIGSTLDVLHATSAALIDGMRDILLESDFENAMKVLTSWIPIRDEDLFMRVAKAEWKMHRKKVTS